MDDLNTALIIVMIVCISVAITGGIGNLLTIATLIHQFTMKPRFRYIKKWTADLVLILNLAFADLFYSAINLPVTFTVYYNIHKKVSIMLFLNA